MWFYTKKIEQGINPLLEHLTNRINVMLPKGCRFGAVRDEASLA
jgi:cytochrome c5